MAKTQRQGRFSEPGERVPLSFRVTPEFKRKIDQIAAASGKSIAQEMEQRLERSLAAEQHLEEALEMAYGPWLCGLILTIARAMRDTGPNLGFFKSRTPEGAANWRHEPWAFDQAARAANTVIEYFRPEGPIVPADWLAPLEPGDPELVPAMKAAFENDMGEGFAFNLLGAIAHGVTTGDAQTGSELGEWAVRRRRQLGVPEPDER